MASIRNRSPWKVSVKDYPEKNATFASKKQANDYGQTLATEGITKFQIAQDRDNPSWEVRVRQRGGIHLVKTFPSRKLAVEWATEREAEILSGRFVDPRAAEKVTVGDLFQRFADTCTKPGPSGDPERYRLRALQKQSFAKLRVSELRSSHIKKYRKDELTRGVKPATVLKGLELINRVLNTAHSDWEIKLPVNPAGWREVKRPKPGPEGERNRTLAPVHFVPTAEEVGRRIAQVSGNKRREQFEERVKQLRSQGVGLDFHPAVVPLLKMEVSEFCALMRAARYPHWFVPVPAGCDYPPLIVPGKKARERVSKCRIWAIVSFAIETAMRRGEITKLEWTHVHLEDGFIHLPAHTTKGNRARDVPLTLRAMRVLRTQPRVGKLVFDATVESIERAYELVVARCGSQDLHFHDLRHEATTRLIHGTTLTPLIIGGITGHRDLRMLARYYNPKAHDIVKMFHASRR